MTKKPTSLDPVVVKRLLLDSSSIDAFLKKYFELRVELFGRPGYSVFSQRAGFSSRSHIRDILSGRVQITEASMVKIAKALGFKGDVVEFFYLKAKTDQIEKFTQSRQGIDQMLQPLKHKIEMELDPLKVDDQFTYRALTSVPKSRYPEFKTALSNLLVEFMDNVDSSSEQAIQVEIVCAANT